jgi:hypothetical protein
MSLRVLLDSRLRLLGWLLSGRCVAFGVAVVEDTTSILDRELDDALIEA